MSLAPGTKLGAYEIGVPLGAGGMGEVYRAKDTKLDRQVAIKVLPESFAADADRVARFTREAKALASLNHPNIAAIYGIEDTGTARALVMELVEGDDLSTIVARGPMPAADVLPVARQIADALEAAHDQGIVHRDLKPANVKVRADGTVKVLDFGLAKALDPTGSSASADAMNSPTLTARATQLGMILGTAAYMAPEQAKGKGVDRRADVWAFGCVLFEMLAGTRAFAGEDVSETLASVLKSDVDWKALPATTPPALVDLIRRCLERDPRQRLQAIGEARILLSRPASGVESSVAATSQAPPTAAAPRSRTLIWALAGLTIGIVGAVAVPSFWRAPEVASVSRYLLATQATPDSISLSPNGRTIVFATGTKIWIWDLDRLQPRELAGLGLETRAVTASNDAGPTPAWSPDGTSIVYGSGSKIWRVPVSGGAPTLVCDSPGTFRGAAWRPDNTILISTTRGPVYQVSANGGEARVLIPLNGTDDVDFHDLSVMPDGKHLIYTVHRTAGADTIETWLDGTRTVIYRLEGRARENPQVINQPRYSPSGHIVYKLEQGNVGVWALPFSLASLKPTGEPFLVAAGGGLPTLAPNGTLAYVYAASDGPRQLTWFKRDGTIDGRVGDPRKLLRHPRISSDGKRVTFAADEANSDIWVANIDGSGLTRLTQTPDNEDTPAWIPGQNAVAYSCPTPTGGAICAKNADGTGTAKILAEKGTEPIFSPDGRYLLYQSNGQAKRGVFVLDLKSPSAKPEDFVISTDTVLPIGVLPGGAFAVYWTLASGRPTSYVKPFPRGEGRWEVNGLPDDLFLALMGGKALAVLEPRPNGTASLIKVPIETSPSVTIGAKQDVFTNLPEGILTSGGWDLSADATRLLVAATVTSSADVNRHGIVIVQNWLSEFAAKK